MISSSLPWAGTSLPYCKSCRASLPPQQINGVSFASSTLGWFLSTFSSSAFPVGERPYSYFLRAFCLCALVRYFLVQKSYCVDLQMCMVAYKLKRGNPVSLILAVTLNGLDAFHKKEVSFFARSPLLLRV